MTVKEFLLYHTKVNELVMIQSSGYNCQAVWIDHEDIFQYHPSYANLEVKNDYWGTLVLTDRYGYKTKVPCHYIDT
jgi:hypothetical protein